MNNIPWSLKEIEFLKHNFTRGTWEYLLSKLDRSKKSIQLKAHRLNLKRKVNYWTKEEIKLLKKYRPLHTVKELAKIISSHSVNSIKFKKYELKLRKKGKYSQKRLNHRFFNKWNKEMAYILGVIAADGCILKNKDGRPYQLTIGSIDYKWLKVIRKMLSSTHTLDIRTNNKNPYYVLRINSMLMANKLVSLGILPQKSKNLEFPKVPKKYLNHFIRGYFDGDGCIYIGSGGRTIDFPGTHSFLMSLSKIFTLYLKIPFKDPYKTKIKGFYRLQYSRREYISKIKNWIYKDSTVCLQRKFCKLNEAVK